ncbi:PREDICTED: putative uncharacterized protein DDB_G0285119 [Rhagoletis zephyria]|uniref:putative uncharacterized protein DDB_G0285119 n=1 Tax=Rhagoletis zephyria TaxID=28612 RepID=UPI0008118AD8|nr:PREDICTED: putative uncharacterized protein DDB_G0285119 [Rhagoletis zephyria]
MAKTRIKTTPMRLKKDALMATTARTAAAITKSDTTTATTCHIAAPLNDAKKRFRQSAVLANSVHSGGGSSTIIVTAPKRTNSISSVASSISQISDANSDTESPPPQTALKMSTTTTTTTTAAATTKSLLTSHISSQAPPRTLNSLLCKHTNAISTLRNRKVFMITEKSDEPKGAETSTTAAGGGATSGQKRKMYLIMEENSCPEDCPGGTEEGGNLANDGQNYVKRENGLIVGAAGGSKKLTLFADKADSGVLTEEFEKILPEILNRIQAKDTSAAPMVANVTPPPPPPPPAPVATSKLLNGITANLNIVKSEPVQPQPQPQQQQQHNLKKTTEETNERLPITLPPKKNRTKIISTNSSSSTNNISQNGSNIVVNPFSDNFNSGTGSIWGNFSNSNNNKQQHKIGTQCQIKQISAATPVIVSAPVNVAARNNNNNHSNNDSAPVIKRFAPHNINHNANNNNTNISYASNASQANGQATTSMAQVELVPHKNINLSTDFHFLIKMLPKLESIPEPHKNNVKNCIERIITQNANIFAKQ